MTEPKHLSLIIPKEDRDKLEDEIWSLVVQRRIKRDEEMRNAIYEVVNLAVEAAMEGLGS